MRQNRDEHPSGGRLEEAVRGLLPADDCRAVLRHLRRCTGCRDRLEALAGTDGEGDFAAVLAAARRQARQLAREREAAPAMADRLLAHYGEGGAPRREPITWGLCEELLERSRRLRHDDPAGMARLAGLACTVAGRLHPRRYGAPRLADLRARAWIELANARRVADDLAGAERAVLAALAFRRDGTGDPWLLARIADLTASLRAHQRRFAEALRLLDLAGALYSAYGDRHGAGRSQILQGIHTGRAGQPEEAIRLLGRGLALIDRDRDPQLVFATLHNLLLFTVEAGEFRGARRQLFQIRPLYAVRGGRLDRLKLGWLEGKIAAGLGELERAERAFAAASQGFQEAALPYHAALAALDLAGVLLRQGRTVEVRTLVEEMIAVFRARQVAREALAAFLLLRDTFARDGVRPEPLHLAAALLKELEQGPGPRLEPEGR